MEWRESCSELAEQTGPRRTDLRADDKGRDDPHRTPVDAEHVRGARGSVAPATARVHGARAARVATLAHVIGVTDPGRDALRREIERSLTMTLTSTVCGRCTPKVMGYVAAVPADRRETLNAIRQLFLGKFSGYDELMRFGMPGYARDGVVEIGFASQKQYILPYVLKQDVLDHHLALLRARGQVVGVDRAVAEVAHKEIPAEGAEARGRERQTPRRVEIAARDQVVEQLTAGVIDVEEPVAGPSDVVVLGQVCLA
jgi:hypothetical protein